MGNSPETERLEAVGDYPEYHRFESVATRASDWPPGWATRVELEMHRDAMYVLGCNGRGPRVMLRLAYTSIKHWLTSDAMIRLETDGATLEFVTPAARSVARALNIVTGRMAAERMVEREAQRRRDQHAEETLRAEAAVRLRREIEETRRAEADRRELDAFFNPA
jgi:hypothetical protein